MKKIHCQGLHAKMCFYYKVVRKEIFTVWYGAELSPVSFFCIEPFMQAKTMPNISILFKKLL
jgi:hypothetical protein